MINAEDDTAWPGPPPPGVETFILETVEVIHELDDSALHEMTPLFYQHGYEQLMMSHRDLLTILGYDLDA